MSVQGTSKDRSPAGARRAQFTSFSRPKFRSYSATYDAMTQAERARALGMSARMLRRYETRGCPRDLAGAERWLAQNVVRRIVPDEDDTGLHAVCLSDALNSGLLWFMALHCCRQGIDEKLCISFIDVVVATAEGFVADTTGGELDLGADFERWRAAPYSTPASPGKTPINELAAMG